MHRYRGGGSHAIAELAKLLGNIHVKGAATGPADLILRDVTDGEPGGRIEYGEVKAKFVEAFVEQTGEQRSGTIQRVLGRHAPERFLRPAGLCSLFGSHGERFLHIAAPAAERIYRLLPG